MDAAGHTPPQKDLPQRKAWRCFWLLIAFQALALPLSRGEFWPFSIFPMFSGAGKPWARSIVTRSASSPGASTPLADVVALQSLGIDQNDLAATLNNMRKAKHESPAQQRALRARFAKVPQDAPLWLQIAKGRIATDTTGTAQVQIAYEPSYIVSGQQVRKVQ